jgi:hypothetical protein
VLAAALCTAGLAGASSASAAMVVKHSAKSGELQDGRLTLHGVSKRVAYSIDGGRSGKVSVRRLHRRVFLPGLAATGRLHVAGRRGGRDRRFKLTRPRYNAARHTVSYRAKSLDRRRSRSGTPRAAGIPALRNFGAAKLSIVPHPRLASGDQGGNDCEAAVYADASEPFTLSAQTWSKWDTDSWVPDPSHLQRSFLSGSWESDGGQWRGCSNTVNFQAVPNVTGYGGLFTVNIQWPWGQNSPTSTCSVDGSLSCTQEPGVSPITWRLHATN